MDSQWMYKVILHQLEVLSCLWVLHGHNTMYQLVGPWWAFSVMSSSLLVTNPCNPLVLRASCVLAEINWHRDITEMLPKPAKNLWPIRWMERGCTKRVIWWCGCPRVNYSTWAATTRWSDPRSVISCFLGVSENCNWNWQVCNGVQWLHYTLKMIIWIIFCSMSSCFSCFFQSEHGCFMIFFDGAGQSERFSHRPRSQRSTASAGRSELKPPGTHGGRSRIGSPGRTGATNGGLR